MITPKIQVIAVVTVLILNMWIVYGQSGKFFPTSNYRVDLQKNTVFPLKSVPYQRGIGRRLATTRVAFIGQRGQRLSLKCNINFSKGCRRSDCGPIITRPGKCCDDFFYVGFNLNPRIQGARRFCGRRTIRQVSQPAQNTADGRPVLIIGEIYNYFSSSIKRKS